jgi:hypothetical protein
MLIFDLRWLLFALTTLLVSVALIAVGLTRRFEQRRQYAARLLILQALLEDAPIGVLLLANSLDVVFCFYRWKTIWKWC